MANDNTLEIKSEMESCLKNLQYYIKKIHDLVYQQLHTDYANYDMWLHEADLRAEALKAIAASYGKMELESEMIRRNMEYCAACKMTPLAEEKKDV